MPKKADTSDFFSDKACKARIAAFKQQEEEHRQAIQAAKDKRKAKAEEK